MTQRVLLAVAVPGDEVSVAASTLLALADGAGTAVLLAPAPSPAAEELGIAEQREIGVALDAAPSDLAVALASAIVAAGAEVVLTPGPDLEPHDPRRERLHAALLIAADVLGLPLFVATSGPATTTVEVANNDRRAAAFAAVGRGDPAPAREGFLRVDARFVGADDAAPHRTGPIAAVVTLLVSLALGALAGFTLTLVHGQSVVVSGVPVPWGVVTALALIAALLAGQRLVVGRAGAAACAAGLLATEVALAAGPVLIADSPAGWSFTLGSLALGVAAIAWRAAGRPRRSGRLDRPAAKGS